MTMTTTPSVLTWDDLAAREPRLAALRQAVERVSAHGRPHYCANAVWYGYGGGVGFRSRVTQLVGWGSNHPDPALRSSVAYDVVYQTLYDLLPDCRDCGCAVEWA